jgi:hypothetical protein
VSSYSASVRIDDGTLHVSRPLTAPEKVSDMIDALVYGVTSDGPGDVLAVELTIATAGESDHPIGDSIAATSSAPLAGMSRPDETLDDDELAALDNPTHPAVTA